MSISCRAIVSFRSCSSAIALVAFALSAFAPTLCSAVQQTPNPKLARPIEGSLILAGEGEVPDYVVDCFIHLCGEASPEIVVVCLDGKPKISTERWKQRGAKSVQLIDSIPTQSDHLVLSLLNANGVWFEGDAKPLRTHSLFPTLVRNVAERGGVVGGAGVGTFEITEQTSSGNTVDCPQGFCLLPRSTIQFSSFEQQKSTSKTPDKNTAPIQWHVPESSAFIVHHGRQVSALGANNVDVRLAGNNEWPERTAIINSIDAFDPGDIPAYNLDLLSWLRSSLERQGPVFPPEKAPATIVENGTLILHGGSGVDEETFERFIDAAGGKDAAFVCLPSASNFDSGEEPNSYSAERLRELGCNDVTILHTTDPLIADQDVRLLEALKRAQGIWIDGGRTYRMMDRFGNTKAEELMRSVLERDGVIGGSSAGCQVAGDFLVRGNPRTNKDLVFEGYTRGFGFIEGVILDAHFLQRGRGETFEPLMKQYPQMLGIGIDEKTAIAIRGTVAEVLGSNSVSFYDVTTGANLKSIVLQNGAKYDLQKRQQVK